MGLIACAALAACGGGDGQDESLAQNEGATQATALATTTGSWGWVADENGSFTLDSQRTVRYGINGKWVQKTLAAGNFSCVDSVFGRDPAGRSTKRCEVYRSGGTTPPAPATASLAWDASSGVTGYRVYYGTAAHTYQQAKDAGPYSNEVSKQTP